MSQLDDEVTVVITNKPDSELYAVFEESNFDVNVGESAKIDVSQAINYIKSGQAEIAETVGDITTAFNENAVEKTNQYNINAEDKTGAFNLNALNKTNDFNTNATDKTTAFNNNYTEKKDLIDAEVQTAETYSAEAKQWAIGDPTEPVGYSSKYWAEASASAAATVGNGTITLTQGGATKGTFTTNQSGNATINLDAGGTWGYITGDISNQTDLQNALNAKANVSSLSTVATSGSYNDLSNKPTIPTVNNATLTIQKNGTTVNTFTANASSNVTANITVPTNTNELTNGAGFITGISSSDVTTALGFTPANSSNTVNTTDDQDVGGVKKLTEKLVRKHSRQTAFSSVSTQVTAITKGTNPTTNTEARWYMTDSNGDFGNAISIAGMLTGYSTSGTTSAILVAFKPEANSTTTARLGIYYPVTGGPYTEAPTPATSDNSTKIATTAYVHNFFAAISGYDATKTQTLKNVNGTLTWVNN